MITINNSVFEAQGADKKDKVYGIVLTGSEDVIVKDCVFKNTGYAAILNHCTGNVTIENCEFECGNIYNPIEGSQSVDNGNVIVKGCKFAGAPGNNYVNFYQFANHSNHEISDCTFEPTVDNNIVRFSNRTSAAANVVIKNCEYKFAEGGIPSDYTAMILCQDYTAKSGVKQDFTGLNIAVENVTCDGEAVTADGAKTGNIFYVYEDGKGLITGLENDPKVVVK